MSDLKLRRENILKDIPNNSLVILFSGNPIHRSSDSTYDFVVNRNFYYLTNISQENTYLILYKNNINQEYLFIDEYSEQKEKWYGKKIREETAKDLSKINTLYFNNSFEKVLDRLINNNVKNVYVDFDNPLPNEINDKLSMFNLNNIYQEFIKYRMKKDEDEIENIKKAIHVTHLGIKRIIKELKTSNKEYEIYNAFNQEILNNGTHEIGFPSIIASGINACILHYPTPYDDIAKDSLILCDVGAAYNHYSSDITRTLPSSGKFTELEKKIYEIVLGCNKAVIEHISPARTLKELQEYAKNYLCERCLEAGLIAKKEDINNVYYHNVSHHLGLDTHDISERDLPLEEGNVITVEPGLYFKDLKIGVRIEDDVLVTKDGSLCLSTEIEKEVNDIENLFK